MGVEPTPHADLVEVNQASEFEFPRVLLISSSTLEREALSLILERGGFQAYASARDIDAVRAASRILPDLVLVDVPADPVLADSLWFIELRHLLPVAHVVLLSDRLNPDWLLVCRNARLAGYLSKASPGPVIYRQLRLILEGERILPLKILREMFITAGGADAMPEATRVQTLSKRDWDVLQLLVAGQSNKMIADRLLIAESTVKVVLKSIFAKIRVTNRTQAALWALGHGLDQAFLAAAPE